LPLPLLAFPLLAFPLLAFPLLALDPPDEALDPPLLALPLPPALDAPAVPIAARPVFMPAAMELARLTVASTMPPPKIARSKAYSALVAALLQ
jgi:hypothetical protein